MRVVAVADRLFAGIHRHDAEDVAPSPTDGPRAATALPLRELGTDPVSGVAKVVKKGHISHDVTVG